MMPKLLAVAILLVPIASIALPDEARKPSIVPSPGLSPGRVIEIQLEALQHNDEPVRDAGIAIAFRFASPANREVTGPLERFVPLVKSPAYRPLLGHRIAGFGPIVVAGDAAARRVTVVADDGRAYEFEFRLSKDPKSGCWFTDGVVPIPSQAPIDQGKVA